MKITKTEIVTRLRISSSENPTKHACVYTQPLHNYIAHWLYHYIWEKLTWRIYRLIEKLMEQNKRAFEDDLYIPLTNRQELRCYYLNDKNRTLISEKRIE